MPVTEREAASAVPKQGWVREYVRYAAGQTVAPLIYHLGVGLATLSVTCPIDYGIRYAGSNLRANHFCMLVGRSGEDNKSTALNIGVEVLKRSGLDLIGENPGSAEGMIESLQDKPRQMLPISEMGKFLSTAKAGYYEPIKALFADVWDCTPQQRVRADRQRRTIRAETPRLSVTAACSIPYLEKYTLAEDWTGGFMGRWVVLYGRRERADPIPLEHDDLVLASLADSLRDKAALPGAGYCMGFDTAAMQFWMNWYDDIMHRHIPSNIIGVRARAPTHALKAALLYGWDFGAAEHGHPWLIGLGELEPAVALIELHIRGLVDLAEVIADHPDARLRRSVLQVIDELGGAAKLGEILGVLKMRKRPVVETLDALLEEGVLTYERLPVEGEAPFGYVRAF
jgi:hypothetical protein